MVTRPSIADPRDLAKAVMFRQSPAGRRAREKNEAVILRALALRMMLGAVWFWLTGLAFLILDLYT